MRVIGRTLRYLVGALVAVFVLGGVGVNSANAQQPGAPNAQQPGAPTVAAFLANPGQLLQQNPNGGPLLAGIIQQLVLLDPSTFKIILGLLPDANDQQKIAIAQGLVQAAKIEVLTDQKLAQEWQGQIAEIGDPTFKTAATNAFGDVQLGAIGGAPGGNAGAGLGGPGGGPGGGGGGGPQGYNPVTTPFFTYTGSTTGTGVPSTTTTTVVTTTVVNPVSPR
jgi:hypothetical protein